MGKLIRSIRARPVLVTISWLAFVVGQLMGDDDMFWKLVLLSAARVLP